MQKKSGYRALYLLAIIFLLVGCGGKAKPDSSQFLPPTGPSEGPLPTLSVPTTVTDPAPTEVVSDTVATPTMVVAPANPEVIEPTSTPVSIETEPEVEGDYLSYQAGEYEILVDPLFPKINPDSWATLLKKANVTQPKVWVKIMYADNVFEYTDSRSTTSSSEVNQLVAVGDTAFALAVSDFYVTDWPTSLDSVIAWNLMFTSGNYNQLVEQGQDPAGQLVKVVSEHPLFTGIDYGPEGERYQFAWGKSYRFEAKEDTFAWYRPYVPDRPERYDQEDLKATFAETSFTGYLIPGVRWGSGLSCADFFAAAYLTLNAPDGPLPLTVFIPAEDLSVFVSDNASGEEEVVEEVSPLEPLEEPGQQHSFSSGHQLIVSQSFPGINTAGWEKLWSASNYPAIPVKLVVNASSRDQLAEFDVTYSADKKPESVTVYIKQWIPTGEKRWPSALDQIVAEQLFNSVNLVVEGAVVEYPEKEAAQFLSQGQPLFTGIDYGPEGEKFQFAWGKQYTLKLCKEGAVGFKTTVVDVPARRNYQVIGYLSAGEYSGVLIPAVELGSSNTTADFMLFTQTSDQWMFIPVTYLNLLEETCN